LVPESVGVRRREFWYHPAMSDFISVLTIFVLAMWVGFEVITKVPPILHTPLTSGSNAISGITVVGSMIAVGAITGAAATGLGFFATVFATINVVGGFLVTHRMLQMFRKKD
jgi:NAD(P) transhydrogenase subunit alpha